MQVVQVTQSDCHDDNSCEIHEHEPFGLFAKKNMRNKNEIIQIKDDTEGSGNNAVVHKFFPFDGTVTVLRKEQWKREKESPANRVDQDFE